MKNQLDPDTEINGAPEGSRGVNRRSFLAIGGALSAAAVLAACSKSDSYGSKESTSMVDKETSTTMGGAATTTAPATEMSAENDLKLGAFAASLEVLAVNTYGAALDAAGKRGAVTLMTGLLEEGSGKMDSQGFAEARFGIQQHAVRRCGFAGGDAHDVADRQLRRWHRFAAAVGGFAQGQCRAGARQRIDLGDGDVARALFQQARGQQQEHEHHRRVVPDVRPAAHGLDHAGDIGEQGGQRHQRVHARRARAQFAPGT